MAYFEIFRGTQAEVNAQAIIDGQVLYTTDLGVDDKIYKDVGSNRTILSNDNGVTQSYTPTATNLGTITIILAKRNGGSVRFKLEANSGVWTAGTFYTLCNLSANFRPDTIMSKRIQVANNFATLIIATDGNVYLSVDNNLNDTPILIDETFII